jgi:hypothetical protein
MEELLLAGQNAYLKLGNSLQLIRDGEYYKGQYSSFEEYCGVRWPDITFRTAQVLIQAWRFYTLLPAGIPFPYQKSLRALAPLTNRPDLVRQAWRRAQQAHGERGDRGPSETEVRQAVRATLGIAPHTSTSSAPKFDENERHLAEAIEHLTWLRNRGDSVRLRRASSWLDRNAIRGG